MRKIRLTKRGNIAEDPRGLHVTLTLNGRTYLGEVTDCAYNHVRGACLLKVRYFNREDWPFEPSALAVDVLE